MTRPVIRSRKPTEHERDSTSKSDEFHLSSTSIPVLATENFGLEATLGGFYSTSIKFLYSTLLPHIELLKGYTALQSVVDILQNLLKTTGST